MKRLPGWAKAALGAAAILLGFGLGLAGTLGWRAWHHDRRRGSASTSRDAGAGPLVAGRILDRQGRPIAGAKVALSPERRGPACQSPEAVTDAKGRFALAAGPGLWRLTATAAGFRSRQLPAIEAPAEGIELELLRSLSLQGVVRSGGKPAPGAELALSTGGEVRTARSGPDGAFGFDEVAEGPHALRATRGDEAAYLDAVMVGGANSPLTVELKPAGGLIGRLRDRAGGAIAGGEITLEEAALAPLPRRVKSGPDGSFHFPSVLPGSYLVSARAPGYLAGPARTVRVPQKGPALSLELERGATVRGQVVDEQGNPVKGAMLEVSGEGQGGAPIAVSGEVAALAETSRSARVEAAGELGVMRGPIPFPPAMPLALAPSPASADEVGKAFVTDAHGAFALGGLPPGKLVVAASHPDFARAASEPIEVGAGASVTVRIVLEHGRTISGRVVDERGDPLPGAELLGGGLTLAVSGAGGEFRIEHVARALALTCRLAGYLPAERTIATGESAPLELTLARAEGRLSGVVVDDRGAPLTSARLEISAPPLAPRSVLTGEGGQFHVEGLSPGPYRVRVSHADFAPAVFEGIEPGDDARFDLQPGGGLDGEVRDARTGETPHGVQARIIAGAVTRTILVEAGHFRAAALPAGRARLEVSAPGYVAWWRELELPSADRPGEVTAPDVDVELERGGAVTGQVLDDDGAPVGAAQVSCGALTVRSDGEGEFRIEGVEPGRYLVRAQAAGARGAAEVEVREGAEAPLEIRLR